MVLVGEGLRVRTAFATEIFVLWHPVFDVTDPLTARFAPVAHTFKEYVETLAVLESVPLSLPVLVPNFRPEGSAPVTFQI